MKNMSFGKMMALFGGFVLLLIVCAVVIIKLTAKAPVAAQVTTKKYTPPARTDHPVAEQSALQVPGESTPGARNSGSVPLPAPAGANASQAVGVPAPQPVNTTPVIVADVKPHLNSLDASVNQLEARVLALENRQRAIAAAPASARPARVHRVPAKAKPVLVQERVAAKPLTPMPGYKSMAVIGNRAWLATPDGHEESVSAGDPVPRPRVRSLDKETGVVVTTSDERIGAH